MGKYVCQIKSAWSFDVCINDSATAVMFVRGTVIKEEKMWKCVLTASCVRDQL